MRGIRILRRPAPRRGGRSPVLSPRFLHQGELLSKTASSAEQQHEQHERTLDAPAAAALRADVDARRGPWRHFAHRRACVAVRGIDDIPSVDSLPGIDRHRRVWRLAHQTFVDVLVAVVIAAVARLNQGHAAARRKEGAPVARVVRPAGGVAELRHAERGAEGAPLWAVAAPPAACARAEFRFTVAVDVGQPQRLVVDSRPPGSWRRRACPSPATPQCWRSRAPSPLRP